MQEFQQYLNSTKDRAKAKAERFHTRPVFKYWSFSYELKTTNYELRTKKTCLPRTKY
jgi:hypothetical protein